MINHNLDPHRSTMPIIIIFNGKRQQMNENAMEDIVIDSNGTLELKLDSDQSEYFWECELIHRGIEEEKAECLDDIETVELFVDLTTTYNQAGYDVVLRGIDAVLRIKKYHRSNNPYV